MSTTKATLEASADGTVHLPLPQEFQHGPLNITATVELARANIDAAKTNSLKGFGSLKGRIWIAPDFDEPLDDFKEYMK